MGGGGLILSTDIVGMLNKIRVNIRSNTELTSLQRTSRYCKARRVCVISDHIGIFQSGSVKSISLSVHSTHVICSFRAHTGVWDPNQALNTTELNSNVRLKMNKIEMELKPKCFCTKSRGR